MLELLAGERKQSESDSAVIACNDWLRTGAGRSIPNLLAHYQQQSAIISNFKPPTLSYKTLNTWSSRFDWPSRATEFDATWEARKNAEREAEFNFGLALDFERVRKLKRLADFLEAQLFEQGEDGEFLSVWVPDVKSIGSGEFAERVDIERFNAAIFSEYRATLDDLAKEVGGRVKKNEHTGKDGAALSLIVKYPDDDSDD